MKLLKELLSLNERSSDDSEIFTDLDMWDQSGLEPAAVEVFYDYERASHSDHPYGDTTAREYHDAQLHIGPVELVADANVLDDDEKVIRTIKKGTDLMKEPFWTKQFTEYLEDRLHTMMDKRGDDR